MGKVSAWVSVYREGIERLGTCVTERLRGANFQRSDQCCVYLSTQTTRHALAAIRSLFGVIWCNWIHSPANLSSTDHIRKCLPLTVHSRYCTGCVFCCLQGTGAELRGSNHRTKTLPDIGQYLRLNLK